MKVIRKVGIGTFHEHVTSTTVQGLKARAVSAGVELYSFANDANIRNEPFAYVEVSEGGTGDTCRLEFITIHTGLPFELNLWRFLDTIVLDGLTLHVYWQYPGDPE